MHRLPPAGFTLVELCVTLALAALMVSMASPGFGALRDEWALRAATHAVLAGLAEARLGALSGQGEAELCPALETAGCAERGSAFWVRAGPRGAVLTLRHAALPAGVVLSANRPAATYYAWPRAASPVTLTLCAVRQHARSRRVIVSQTGRPRVERAGAC